MAIYRSIYLSFWDDPKIADSFTPEDKLFMLYCLTNSHTNIIGCYEISVKQMAYEIGYSKESIELLLNRFITIHKNIDYDYDTHELFIKNWYKYNWTSSEKLEKNVISNISKVKSKKFREELIDIYNSRDTLSIPYIYPMDTSDTITNTNSNTINYNNMIKEIIDYLNMKTKKNYRSNNKETIKHIKARINEEYKIEDFKKVIDNQCEKWMNTNMEDYLRPQTLFGTKFESYLNTNNYYNKPQKPSYELPTFN